MILKMYEILLQVNNKEKTPEEAQIELLQLFNTTNSSFNDTYRGQAIKNCKLGLYEIFWKEGGSSLASIGNMYDGVRWIAPSNWTSKKDPTGRLDTKMIKKIEKIILLYKK